MENKWLERRLTSVSKRANDHRSPFQRDRARVLHAAAFRRLQSKTQVMGSGQSDFYRTRLTHSLEASQIGSGIVAQLKSKYPELCANILPQDDALIETLCLAHDIGHPPFGHGGEVALHYMMRKHGGFEGNGQTFRIVSKLEPFSEHFGMNLSRRTLLGLLKYPQTIDNLDNQLESSSPNNFRQLKASEWHPPKGIYTDDIDVLDWVLAPLSMSDRENFQYIIEKTNKHHKTQFKSVDCSIMELADDIAYGIHDLEDAIVTRVVNRNDFENHVVEKLSRIDDSWIQGYAESLADNLFGNQHHKQKDAIGGLVNYLITSIELNDLNPRLPHNFLDALLQYNAELPPIPAQVLKIFKDFVFEFVIKQTSIQRVEYRGQQVVMELFEAIESDPMRLLSEASANRWQQAKNDGLNSHRVIADYVASMTDTSATKLYQTLFVPSSNAHYREPNI